MRAVTIKTKKIARLKVIATPAKTLVRFPHQVIGSIALMLQTPKAIFEKGKAPKTVYEDGRIIRQWELVLRGDDLKIVKVISVILMALCFSSCEPAHAETASWYSFDSCVKEGTSGRYTASGERFNENALTAASWQYPFGQKIKVTNLKNDKSVIVKISDRGPAKRLVKKGRVIDLSKAAFNRIASLSDGVIPVRLEAL